MEAHTATDPDGYLFVCKLCGNNHEVPEQLAPYWGGQTLHNILIGAVALGCAEKSGTVEYSFPDFKAYRKTAA
ncbi:MAG TPA: hypothetical protein VGE89_03800 [Bryobacteraceae bacterium]|jgi:predicted metal-binding protein